MSKTKGQFSFFNLEERLEKIHQIADFLSKLDTLVDREMFRYQRQQGPRQRTTLSRRSEAL